MGIIEVGLVIICPVHEIAEAQACRYKKYLGADLDVSPRQDIWVDVC